MFQFWSNGNIKVYSLTRNAPKNISPIAPAQKTPRVGDRNIPVEGSSLPQTSEKNKKKKRLLDIYRDTLNPKRTQTKLGLTVKDIMTSPVSTLTPTDSIREGFVLLFRKGFRHFPITSADGTIAGIVSDRDLLRLSANDLESGNGKKIQEIMHHPVLTVQSEAHIADVAAVMLNENFSSLPVTSSEGKVIGIITSSDILQAIVIKAPINLWA